MTIFIVEFLNDINIYMTRMFIWHETKKPDEIKTRTNANQQWEND